MSATSAYVSIDVKSDNSYSQSSNSTTPGNHASEDQFLYILHLTLLPFIQGEEEAMWVGVVLRCVDDRFEPALHVPGSLQNSG